MMECVFSGRGWKKESKRPAAGSAYIEAVLAALFLVAVTFFTIDIARYFYIYVSLNHAAYRALCDASGAEMRTDIRPCLANPGSEQQCDAYKLRVERMLAKAADLASQAINLHGSLFNLLTFEHYNATYYPTGEMSIAGAQAGFLRPGERVVAEDGTLFDHSGRVYGNRPDQGWPGTGENWNMLLARYPLEMVFVGDFTTVTPGFGRFRMEVRQRNFIEGSLTGVKYSER